MKYKKIARKDFLDVEPNIYTWKSVRDVWGERDIELRAVSIEELRL